MPESWEAAEMPKRSLARRKNALSKLQARIADLDGRPACRPPLDPGPAAPGRDAGCEECLALQRQYDSATLPTQPPTDVVEDDL